MLLTDWLLYGLAALAVIAMVWSCRQPHLRQPWRHVLQRKLGMCACVVLLFYIVIALLDSVHLTIEKTNPQTGQRTVNVESVFDLMLGNLATTSETTYSAPFATHLFNKMLITLPNGKEVRDYLRLKYGGQTLTNPNQQRGWDIAFRALSGVAFGVLTFIAMSAAFIGSLAKKHQHNFIDEFNLILRGKTGIAWREAILTFGIIWVLIWVSALLMHHYHILGTEKVGRDVFYESLKSIRTGILIGTLTTIFMLPFALILGTFAGFFRGFVDDVIQYLYITLSSIPGVLLISATILVLQVYIANHPHLFPTLIQRADARLLALCMILGLTSWASLCRLLRGETLKLREQEYVLAARVLGVGHFKIIRRHIVPNVMHIVLITLVLDFSSLVLAEAVLSYVGVGVDPTTLSWGNMINASRLELAREPMVWWPLLSAFIFMFILVLSANLFADAVRDAFDPSLRSHFD